VVDLNTFSEVARWHVEIDTPGRVKSIAFADERVWLAFAGEKSWQDGLYWLDPLRQHPAAVFERLETHIEAISSVPEVPDRVIIRRHTIFPTSYGLYTVTDEGVSGGAGVDEDLAPLGFLRNGETMMAGPNLVRIDDLSVIRTFTTFPDKLYGGTVSPDGTEAALAGSDHVVAIFGEDDSPVRFLGGRPDIALRALTYSHDGAWLFAVEVPVNEDGAVLGPAVLRRFPKTSASAAAPQLHLWHQPLKPEAGRGSTFHGRVTGDDGVGIGGATVQIWFRRLEWPPSVFFDPTFVTTDDDGQFSVPILGDIGEAPGYDVYLRFHGTDDFTQASAGHEMPVKNTVRVTLVTDPSNTAGYRQRITITATPAGADIWARPAGSPWRKLAKPEGATSVVDRRGRSTVYEARYEEDSVTWGATARHRVRVEAKVQALLSGYSGTRHLAGERHRVYRNPDDAVVSGQVLPAKPGSHVRAVLGSTSKDGTVTYVHRQVLLDDDSRFAVRWSGEDLRPDLRYFTYAIWRRPLGEHTNTSAMSPLRRFIVRP
jgi:hypothetical protein